MVGVALVIYSVASFIVMFDYPSMLSTMLFIVVNPLVSFIVISMGLWLIVKKPKICDGCGRKIRWLKKKIKMVDKEGNELLFCGSCYTNLSKDEKLSLRFAGEKTSMMNMGLAIGGLAGAAGFASGNKRTVEHAMKKYDIKEQEMDERSINKYDKHFWLLTQGQQQIILVNIIRERKKEKIREEINEWEPKADSQKEQLAQSMYGKRFEDCTYKEMKKIKKKLKREVKPSKLKIWK